jgi:uncharacterized membrane protein HdeD (DUF308 family)
LDLGFDSINVGSSVSVTFRYEGGSMIILGLVLMLIGFITKLAIVWSVGIVVAVVGLVLLLMGAAGREIGGRRHYY